MQVIISLSCIYESLIVDRLVMQYLLNNIGGDATTTSKALGGVYGLIYIHIRLPPIMKVCRDRTYAIINGLVLSILYLLSPHIS
jgi:hypothetical protein